MAAAQPATSPQAGVVARRTSPSSSVELASPAGAQSAAAHPMRSPLDLVLVAVLLSWLAARRRIAASPLGIA